MIGIKKNQKRQQRFKEDKATEIVKQGRGWCKVKQNNVVSVNIWSKNTKKILELKSKEPSRESFTNVLCVTIKLFKNPTMKATLKSTEKSRARIVQSW